MLILMFSRAKAVWVTAATTAVLTGYPASAAKAADTSMAGQDSLVIEHPGALIPAERQRIEAYWTPRRMARAMHGGEDADPVSKEADTLPGQDRSKPNTGAVWGGGGKITQSVGRLFMTSRDDDGSGLEVAMDRSCTATVVDSPSGTTVLTAAHCLQGHPGWPGDKRAEWNTNVYFVPGYRDGLKPQGGFTVNTSYVARPYHDQMDEASDAAMLAMNPAADGRTVAAVTGSQKIQFNAPRHTGQFTYNFGYSADSYGKEEPWKTGQLLGYCAGPAARNTQLPTSNHWGMPCNMIRGSSGGPHLTGFDPKSGTGTVVGVNSGARRVQDKRVEDAAPLNDSAHKLYLRAQHPHTT